MLSSKPVAIIDASGLACPLPLLKLKQWLKSASARQQVLLRATDINSQRDIRRFCEIAGHILLSVEADAAVQPVVYTFHIEKNAA